MRPRLADLLRLLGSIAVLGAFAIVAWKLGLFKAANVEKVSAATGNNGSRLWLSVVYVVIYAIVATLALPVSPLAYGAGAVFGFIRGGIVVWTGSMFGAMTGYLLARYVWAGAARRLLGSHKEKLKDLREDNPALKVFRMQVMPVVPFGIFNYAAAVAKLPLPQFLLGTAFGVIPGSLIATFIGDRFLAGVHGPDKTPLFLAIGAALLLLALSFVPTLVKKTRNRSKS